MAGLNANKHVEYDLGVRPVFLINPDQVSQQSSDHIRWSDDNIM
jgi:hypothetical protein